MAVPTPLASLSNSCSVIHNDTLFVYSQDSFQSIRLAEGEQWSKLPHGVPALGARCAYALPHGNQSEAALYVVGGMTDLPVDKFSGIQKFSFADGKWKNITMTNNVASNRTNHDAVFVNQNATILIFSGTQRGPSDKVPSMETFCVHTEDNFRSIAYSAEKAPQPRSSPQLLQWNQSHAAMIGGGSFQEIYLFAPQYRAGDSPWTKLAFNLPKPIPDRTKVQAIIVQGTDGSKVLETFDMSVTPNIVERIVLDNAGGKGPAPGQSIGESPPKRRRRRRSSAPAPAKRLRRDLSTSNWPAYNSSLAPSTTRQGYSISQDSKGLVAVVGGDEQAPLLLFDSARNSWLNSTEFLGGKATVESVPTPTSTTSSTPTSTQSASPTPTNDSSAVSRSTSLTILGATLGAVFGAALFLALILYLLRRCKKRREYNEAGHQRRSSGLPEDDALSFVDRGVSFGSDVGFIPRGQTFKNGAHQSSMAIVGGRTNHPPQKRGLFSKGRTGSGTSSIFSRVRGKPQMGSEMQMEKPGVSFAPSPVLDSSKSKGATDGAGKQRSSGWSRYFSGASATNLAMPAGGRQASYTEKTHSAHGSQSGLTSGQAGRTSAPFALSRSDSGNVQQPSSQQYGSSTAHAPQLNRHSSSSTVSSMSRNDAFSSGIPASVHEDSAWTPMRASDWNGRAPSSIYTESNRGSVIPRDDNFTYPRDSTATRFPRAENGTSAYPQRGPGISIVDPAQNHEFGAAAHSDMSWLNLGNVR